MKIGKMKEIKHKEFEYSQITKYIYIGNNMCCQEHFSKELLKKEVKADISLEEKRLDYPFGVEFYLWMPVKEHYPPTQDQFKLGAAVLKKLIELKKKVYIHCEKGHVRAPTLTAAYFISQGMSLKEALNLLKLKRPVIHLNTRQITGLKKFERSIKNKN